MKKLIAILAVIGLGVLGVLFASNANAATNVAPSWLVDVTGAQVRVGSTVSLAVEINGLPTQRVAVVEAISNPETHKVRLGWNVDQDPFQNEDGFWVYPLPKHVIKYVTWTPSKIVLIEYQPRATN